MPTRHHWKLEAGRWLSSPSSPALLPRGEGRRWRLALFALGADFGVGFEGQGFAVWGLEGEGDVCLLAG